MPGGHFQRSKGTACAELAKRRAPLLIESDGIPFGVPDNVHDWVVLFAKVAATSSGFQAQLRPRSGYFGGGRPRRRTRGTFDHTSRRVGAMAPGEMHESDP